MRVRGVRVGVAVVRRCVAARLGPRRVVESLATSARLPQCPSSSSSSSSPHHPTLMAESGFPALHQLPGQPIPIPPHL